MKSQFVNYEIALALKELGFDEECLRYYGLKRYSLTTEYATDIGELLTEKIFRYLSSYQKDLKLLKAPFWQQAIDWLREKHNVDIIIKPWTGDIKGEKNYAADVCIFGTTIYIKLEREKFYEEAREAAVLKAIELIKNKEI